MRTIVCLLISLLAAGSLLADSDYFKKFKDDYTTLDQDLLNNPGEVGTIRDFVYQKDVLTLNFIEGQFFFLRYVNNRPTTAIFIGKGKATIDVPSHLERQSLKYASGDTTVSNDFEVCFIRFADDFDLRVKEQTSMTQKMLSWKDFTVAKQAQGEFFFRPVIEHTYDNYFQLLRSCYERASDGYFFCDFNRYTFIFDPNRPEEVIVGYEKEGGAATITDACIMQRREHGVYEDTAMSDIPYLNRIVDQQGTFYMSGAKGDNIDSAVAEVALVLKRDSARFVNFFLHYNLDIDSIVHAGSRIDFHRRKDFSILGLVLPRYYHRDDTLELKVFYHGKNYLMPLPYTADPTPSHVKVTLIAPKDFVYIVPGMEPPEDMGKGKQKITAEPQQPMTTLQFRSFAKTYSEIAGETKSGMALTFLKSPTIDKKNVDCFVPDNIYQPAVSGALDFLVARLGNPPNAFAMTIQPEGNLSIPGHAEVTQDYCLREATGGIHLVAGKELARQWFGASVRPQTDRELWIADAATLYLGLMYTQSSMPKSPFYGELLYRREMFFKELERQHDQPLATGDRVADSVRVYKGAWILHMLRQMMFDLEKQSDRTFLKFLQELSVTVNSRTYTNADFIRIAEKYAGVDLSSFFAVYLYGIQVPEYNVTYSIVPSGAEWKIDVSVVTDKVPPTFAVPVTLQVAFEDGSRSFLRQTVAGPQSSFVIGPFPNKPKEIVFNEFASVLAKEKVSKGKS